MYLKVKIAPHPYFRREGNDVFLEVPISVPEAVLGAKVDVPTLDGTRLTVKVPPGTSSGGGCGSAARGIAGGDQYLVFKVAVPAGTVDEASRKLIEEFAAPEPAAPAPRTRRGCEGRAGSAYSPDAQLERPARL